MTDFGPAPGSIELYWIPLGAGGSGFVRMNGRIYARLMARREGHRPRAIYHTALRVHLPDAVYVIETMWPSPDRDTTARGVVVEGPVASRSLGRWRTFRYEVRCWADGILPDAGWAVGGPQTVGHDLSLARAICALTRRLPSLTWGRDESGTGEMWNSNSVISWLLARAGAAMDPIQPPPGGAAPGWGAGLALAGSHHPGVAVPAHAETPHPT